ncbi:MAG: ABC transporter substrate-binding protein [Lachnospiraceae bacterium]|nr:ABC transporter substrate-binding protein [Lachnospiraceae bacterium]
MKKRFLDALLLACMVTTFGAMATGCGKATSAKASEAKTVTKSAGHTNLSDSDGDGILEGGTVKVALGGDMVKFDPAYCYDMYGLPVINQVCECLLRIELDENDNMVLKPCLAESYEVVSDKEYYFTIRDGVKFSDGTDFTVDDVIFSLTRMREVAYAAQFYNNVDTIEAVDDKTVHITLSAPDASFLYTMGHQSGSAIFSKKFYEEHEDSFGDPNTGCVGTGPYAYESWTQGEEIVLTRNEYYWDEGAYLDKVVYDIIPESVTQVAGLQSGDINFVLPVPIDAASTIMDIPSVTTQVESTFGVDFIAFNCTEAPFDDVNVRKAMNYLFDSKSFAENVCNGICEAGYSGSIPESLWLGDKSVWEEYQKSMETYDYDIEKAKECLAASAYPDGFTATITTDSNPVRYNAAIYMQSEAEKIGIHLEVEKISGEQLTARTFESPKNYQMICNYWGSDFPDPVGLVGCLFQSKNADGGSNFSNYMNEDFDKLIASQDSMTDPVERGKVFVEACKMLDEDCPWIMIDYANSTCAMSNDLTGYKVMGVWYLNDFTRLMHYVEE